MLADYIRALNEFAHERNTRTCERLLTAALTARGRNFISEADLARAAYDVAAYLRSVIAECN